MGSSPHPCNVQSLWCRVGGAAGVHPLGTWGAQGSVDPALPYASLPFIGGHIPSSNTTGPLQIHEQSPITTP